MGTTTIRSCRAHPRRVLDTAALNAYVPDYVGSKSKSHSELTWNHVVAVFTFFGLLMTALVSLCCWSHFQFTVERRRLGAIPSITVKKEGVGDNANLAKIPGKYTKSDVVPTWFTGTITAKDGSLASKMLAGSNNWSVSTKQITSTKLNKPLDVPQISNIALST